MFSHKRLRIRQRLIISILIQSPHQCNKANKRHIEGVGQTLKSRENLESSGLAVMYVEFLKGSVRDSTEKSGLVKSQQAFKGHAIASVWKFTCPSLNI